MLGAKARRQKGDRAEREALQLLRDLLGDHLVRARGEGDNDHGDIPLPRCVVQIKNYVDVARAVRDGLVDAEQQKQNAGVMWGAALIRRRGGRWFMAMSIEDWVSMYREALFEPGQRGDELLGR